MISTILRQSQLSLTLCSLIFITSCDAGPSALNSATKAADPFRPKGEIAVVFYNVENLFDTINDPITADDEYTPGSEKKWGAERYQVKLNRLAEVISKISVELPSFIGLSEIENYGVLADLTSHPLLESGDYGIIHQDSPDQRGIDVALLYRKSHFTPAEEHFYQVVLDEGERPTRDILHAIGGIKNGPEIHLFVNHWPSRGGGKDETAEKRMAASRTLSGEIAKIKGDEPGAFVIAMGDFNDYPGDASLETLKETGMANLMDGLKNTERGSYNYRGDWDFLDQILVSENLIDGEGFDLVVGSTTAFHFPEMLYTDPKYGDEKPNKTYGGDKYYGGYSDHLPVISRFVY